MNERPNALTDAECRAELLYEIASRNTQRNEGSERMGWIRFEDKKPPDNRQYLAGHVVTVESTKKREWWCEVVDAGESPSGDDFTHWLAIPVPKGRSR